MAWGVYQVRTADIERIIKQAADEAGKVRPETRRVKVVLSREWVEDAGWRTGGHWADVPSFEAEFDLTIDWRWLARQMCERAACNKNGRATMMNGAIVAERAEPEG